MRFVKQSPSRFDTQNGRYSVSGIKGRREFPVWVASIRNGWAQRAGVDSWQVFGTFDTAKAAKEACAKHAKGLATA